MRLIPTQLPKTHYKKTKNQIVLEEFVASDAKVVKIEGYPQKTARGCASSLHNAIKRFHVNGVKACTRNGEPYLVKVK